MSARGDRNIERSVGTRSRDAGRLHPGVAPLRFVDA